MTSTTDDFMEILIKTRMKEQKDKKRYRLVVPSSEDEQGSSIESIAETEEELSPEEVVIIVELDPELNPDFALLMVLLRQRADDLHVYFNSKWRMHIVTISNENFDPRIHRLCLPHQGSSHWCFPRYNTYILEWFRHGTVVDTSLKTLVASSSGRISTMMIRTENETNDITGLVEESILNNDTNRVLVICFQPWARIKELLHSLKGHEQAIDFYYYTEEEECKHEAASIVKEILERTNPPQTRNGSKLVVVLFLMNGGSNVMMKAIDSMSGWSTITILGNQQTNQLSWVRRCDTKGIVIITGKDPRMLRDNWGSFTMDDGVRKVLFPKPAFEKRLVKIENDKMAGFYCAVVALDAIFDIHAPTVIHMIGLWAHARIATVESLRYQGILGESPGTGSEPMRLRLEALAENDQQSHMLFLRLLMAFEYDHKLALMVYNSLNGDQDTRVLTILVACTLKLGLEELIKTEQILKVTQTDGGLETLLKMCTGPFRKLAKTGTLWLKLALVHRAVWVDGKLGSYYDNTPLPEFFDSIVH
ncbi:unnamed protein product [Clonostachys rhizophaga]|uniref:Uncharacterized protein n=1 Tax=Clonostachys rhizophaga TaxID=160324 RepID=A0A9N9V543_9HYPO|nr:unnamed protein product [Clonostachys rhizophaga]